MYEKLMASAKYIQSQISETPKVAIVLGSGLGAFVDQVESPTIIPYNDIPHFHQTTVEGHEGRMIIGKIEGVNVCLFQGRLHAYEGHPMEEVVFPIRTLSILGVETLILTNAAGGINSSYQAGDLVIINDHINLQGKNPLIGPNIAELGPRFPDMTTAYSKDLNKIVKDSAKEFNYEMKEGVYAGVLGPTYETPAEVKMIKILGGDMVGMSTVPESIAANHLGIKVCGISCITNMAAGMKDEKLDHKDVKEQAFKVMDLFSNILRKSLSKLE